MENHEQGQPSPKLSIEVRNEKNQTSKWKINQGCKDCLPKYILTYGELEKYIQNALISFN